MLILTDSELLQCQHQRLSIHRGRQAALRDSPWSFQIPAGLFSAPLRLVGNVDKYDHLHLR